MAGPDISIVLTAYNRAALLPRAIESVLSQQDVNFELIVVDDASQDGTAAYLRTLSDPRIRIRIAEKNLGPSGARNEGIELAQAPVVAFLDSDDRYLPGRLSLPLRVLDESPDIVCVLSSARKFDRGIPREARVPDLKLAPAAFEWALLCDLIPVEGTSITVRRDAARAAGGFSRQLRLTEDREFLIRLARLGAGQLVSEMLWEKNWTDDSLSMDTSHIARGLVAYVQAQPDYTGRFARLGSYLATKILVGHVRDRRYGMLWQDYRMLSAAGLIPGNPLKAVRNHVGVRRYRRAMRDVEALARLEGPPADWR